GLLELGVHVRFREATVRTAVHAAATPSERQAAHAAIAAVLADVAHLAIDPAWRAWHRGQAAAAPDEDVAADLAGHADPAVRIGGTSASAAFLRRAALLTPERDARARRALDAAEATSRAGDGDAAMKMLVEAEAVPLDQLGRARAELLRARIASTHGAPDAAQRLRAAARRLEPLDAERAGEAYLEALARAIERGPGAGCDAAAVARDALASRRPESRRPVDLLLEGLAQAVREGWSLRGGPLRRALDALAQDTTHATVLLAWGSVAADAAAACWDHHRQRALAERFAASAQELGALAARHEALAQLVEVRVREGRLTAAEAVLRDLHHGADGTARATATVAALLPAAYRGDADAVAALLGHLGDAAGEPLTGAAAVRAQTARLVLANGLGRHEEGLRGAEAVRRTAASGGAPAWALPELVEAAARSGAAHAVASAVEQLAETAAACGTDWAHGVAARARALVSDGPVAEALHREAIERLGRAGVDIEHARARLVYGEWLRGQGRRVDARAELRAAHAALQQMGAAGFAERARRELAATGEVVRRHGAEDRDELTAQELQIAQLAAAGASNREIGGRLYLSPRTVEWHLRKVFTKLGVGSRRSLGDALPAVAAS
ncbi:MAG TPA: helix-turn-helix transcriptional regulator, partial [Solirubrobacteraceae bacterium]